MRSLLACVVTLALGYGVMAINQALWHGFGATFARWQVSSLPFYLIWVAVGLVASFAMPRVGDVPWRAQRRDTVVCVLVIAGAVAMYAPALLRLANAQMPAVLPLIAGGIVGPVVEEWLFRGLLWNAVDRGRPLVTIAITSLVFGFFHMSFEGHTWATLGSAFVHAGFGALMGVARWRLGGIAFGCAVHAAGNSLWILTAS